MLVSSIEYRTQFWYRRVSNKSCCWPSSNSYTCYLEPHCRLFASRSHQSRCEHRTRRYRRLSQRPRVVRVFCTHVQPIYSRLRYARLATGAEHAGRRQQRASEEVPAHGAAAEASAGKVCGTWVSPLASAVRTAQRKLWWPRRTTEITRS